MTLELFSTSVPSGLEPGRSGFCTVAMTRGIPRPLIELLETLSAYRPLYLPADPRSANNPVAVSHLRVAAGGKTYHLLSRVCAAGLDYTSRSNRFAHHVILEASDPRPAGGPAWLATRGNFLDRTWDGQVRWLESGRAIPPGDTSPGCPTWKKLTGDAGWAGVVAEAMVSENGRPFYLLYEAGTDVLPLIAEALTLLPPARRWAVTFTTYFTGVPAGVHCQLRAVVRGTPEAQAALAGASLDLTQLSGRRPADSEFVQAARTGRRVAATVEPTAPVRQARPAAVPAVAPSAEIPPPPPEFELEPLRTAPRRGGTGLLAGIALGLGLTVGLGVATVFAVRPFLPGKGDASGEPVGMHQEPENEEKADQGGKRSDEKGRDKKADTNPATPKPVDPGQLILKLDTPQPRYGEPVLLTARIDGPAGKLPVAQLANQLQFSLDGKLLARDAARVREDSKVRLFGLEPGEHRLRLEFAGDERFRPAGPVEVPFSVLRNRLGTFRVRALKPELSPGEPVELTLEWLRRRPGQGPDEWHGFPLPWRVLDASILPPAWLDASVWDRFRFQRVPDRIPETGSAGKMLKVRPVPGQPGRFTLAEALPPGTNHITVEYPEDRRFEGARARETARVQVSGHEVVFGFLTNLDDRDGENAPTQAALAVPGEVLRIAVRNKDRLVSRTPRGSVTAFIDGVRVAGPTVLAEGIATLKFERINLEVSATRRKLQLRYDPAAGAEHLSNQRAWDIRIVPVREFRQLAGALAPTRTEGKPSNPGDQPRIAYTFDGPQGQLPLTLPADLDYQLRVTTPARKDTGDHELTQRRRDGRDPNDIICEWKYRKKGTKSITHPFLRLQLVPVKSVTASGEQSNWLLHFALGPFFPQPDNEKEHGQAFQEACKEPHLVRASVIEILGRPRRTPSGKATEDPFPVVRLLLRDPAARTR